MSIVGSVSGSRVLLEPKDKGPEVVPGARKDGDGDIKIKDRIIIENKVELLYLIKVATLLRFLGKPSELREFLAKVNIYIKHNLNSFLLEADKVTFAISYFKGLVFDFAETFLDDYRTNDKSN